jgi:hypothetical protein
MNRILDLQAILPSIDVSGGVDDSNTSISCAGGNCNSSASNGCQDQTISPSFGFY